MELQAKCRSLRIGQTSIVNIYVPYIRGSIDDKHAEKHQTKVDLSVKVSGDSKVDELYANDNSAFANFADIIGTDDSTE